MELRAACLGLGGAHGPTRGDGHQEGGALETHVNVLARAGRKGDQGSGCVPVQDCRPVSK